MMTGRRAALLVFIAALSWSAVASASASAVEWLVGGVVANGAPGEFRGNLILGDAKLNLSMECSVTIPVSLTVRHKKILKTSILVGTEASLVAPLQCTALGGCESAGKTEASAEGLPWEAELTSLTSELIVKATYWSTCRVLGLTTSEECTDENASYAEKNVTGGVESSGEVTPLGNCTVGGLAAASQVFVAGNLLTSSSGTVSIS
jgi:hypothetical protein